MYWCVTLQLTEHLKTKHPGAFWPPHNSSQFQFSSVCVVLNRNIEYRCFWLCIVVIDHHLKPYYTGYYHISSFLLCPHGRVKYLSASTHDTKTWWFHHSNSVNSRVQQHLLLQPRCGKATWWLMYLLISAKSLLCSVCTARCPSINLFTTGLSNLLY